MATATQEQLLSGEQLFKMSASQQSAYFSQLEPKVAAEEKAKLAQYTAQVNTNNTNYLKKASRHYVFCPPSGGGTSATYAANTPLQFNLPTAGGAYLTELEVLVDIKFTPATGSSATYGWTPAGAYAWFSDIAITYGGNTQHHIRPYFLKVLDQTRNKMWLPYAQVLSGLNADATTTSNVAQAQPSLTGGSAAVSKFRFRIPMQIHPLSPVGLLPIQGQGTKGQITLTTAATLGAANPDPMLTPINYTGGSGNGITLDSTEKTITVFAIYTDGINLQSKSAMSLNMEHLPTSQFYLDQQLNPLNSGSVQRQKISSLLQHYFVASVIIDGVQSTSFSTAANITSLELDMDSAGQNKFYFYGASNGTTYYDYAERIRHIYGQDLDVGVVMWANANQFNIVDPDDQEGTAYLDMRSGGWPDTNYGVQVGSVSSSNFTPRIETQLFSLNPAGLVVAG